jgi:apolipoprotein N-acyltransferase
MQKFWKISIKSPKEIVLSLVTGILLGISFPPISASVFLFIALIPYLFVVQKRNGLAEINRITYLTMFVFGLITIYWVGSWTKEADPFLMISGVALLFFNPILFLIPSTLYYLAAKNFGKKTAIFFFPAFWVFYEYIYSVTDLKFPWLSLGNGLVSFNTFIQISDTIGVYGLSLLVLYINVFLYLIIVDYFELRKIRLLKLVVTITLVLFPIIYGFKKNNEKPNNFEKIKFGIIQPNLNPWNKWQEGNLDNLLDIYFDLSDKAINQGAKILVWPETALPVYLTMGSYENELQRIKNFLRIRNVFLLTGMPDATIYYDKKNAPEEAKPLQDTTSVYTSYNSIFLINPNNNVIQKYGKQKLVPFGEKVPFVEYIPFLGDIIKWNVGISSWNTGKDTTVFKLKLPNIKDTVNIGGIICIESIYSDYVAQFADKGAEILVIVTNDSWYGNSSGPYQHKEYSKLRAVENRKFVVRSANGGISCVIDPSGNSIVESKMFTREYLVADVGISKTKTFYAKHPLIIPFLSVLIVITFILLFLFIKLFKRKNEKLY